MATFSKITTASSAISPTTYPWNPPSQIPYTPPPVVKPIITPLISPEAIKVMERIADALEALVEKFA